MLNMKQLTDLDIKNKRVLIREDFNVPIQDGKVTNQARLLAALPTIRYALEKGAAIILMSHLGRPIEGQFDAQYSLQGVANTLSELLQQPINFISQCSNEFSINSGDIVLLENVRFLAGEKANDEQLAKQFAALCDIFVMDAFGTAHRAQASTYGVAQFAKLACAGPLLVKEIEALSKTVVNPDKPLVAIVGGSKVSTKLNLLETLLQKVDQLIVGGGIANTFIAASGYPIGQSLIEKAFIPKAQQLMQTASERGATIPIPTDVVVAKTFSKEASAVIKKVNEVADDEMILDIGPDTIKQLSSVLMRANTIIWNGPVGVFEFEPFANGTKAIAQAIANSHAFSLAGGGDTIAAIEQFAVQNDISYISTGGGAFLEFLQGNKLPAIEILEARA